MSSVSDSTLNITSDTATLNINYSDLELSISPHELLVVSLLLN